MKFSSLLLYSRKGCCLCEGLEHRLRSLPLAELNPPIQLIVIDIDEERTPPHVRIRYDMEVPVLVVKESRNGEEVPLPRVSPRLKGTALAIWLQRACMKAFGLD